jgi:Uma2 family endonuclease
MTTIADIGRKMTFEEYLEFEKSSETRHEFYQGNLIPMPGEKKRHNRIAFNIARLLASHFEPRGCNVFIESVKQEVIPHVYYTYPDIILTCDPADTTEEDGYWVRSPLLLAEVLSDSTASNDLNVKLPHYQNIPSLQYYLVISQDIYNAQLFRRNMEGVWIKEVFESSDALIDFPDFSFSMRLGTVYSGLNMA